METGEDERVVMSNPSDIEFHTKDCDRQYDGYCTCYYDQLDNYFDHEEPTIRQSKSEKPKHVVRGRSIFTLWDIAKRRGKRMKYGKY